MSSIGSSSGHHNSNHTNNSHHITNSSNIGASGSSSVASANGISSIRSSPSTVSSPATVAYGGAMAFERPLPSVTSSSSSHGTSVTGGGHHHSHSSGGGITGSTSSYSASHSPLPSAHNNHTSTPSSSSTPSISSSSGIGHTSGASIASGAPSVGITSHTVHTLPPVAGASAAPSTVSNDDGILSSNTSDDEKMMMESKVTDDVQRMRAHLRSLSSLSKRTFTIGATLGTGTFGRVRLCSYTPPLSASSGPAAVQPRQNYYALKMLKKSEIIRLKQGLISHTFLIHNLTCLYAYARLCTGVCITNVYLISGWHMIYVLNICV